jgi:hypothetical protein
MSIKLVLMLHFIIYYFKHSFSRTNTTGVTLKITVMMMMNQTFIKNADWISDEALRTGVTFSISRFDYQ